MKKTLDPRLSKGRVRAGRMRSDDSWGMNGSFFVFCPATGTELAIVASDGADWQEAGLKGPAWEHVSVSCKRRCPNWIEMCFVKDLFWAEDECVIQFHPPRAEYVNFHPHCLHLWRLLGVEIPIPDSYAVGPREKAAS